MDLRVLLTMDPLSVKYHPALESVKATIEREALEESYLRVVDYPVFLTMTCRITYINKYHKELLQNVLKIYIAY